MSSDGSSTLKSYVDSAVGAAQSVVGSVTGNPADQKQAEDTKNQAEQQYKDSHTTAKLGPISADPNTGAAAVNHEDRSTGSWNQTVGAAKESVGNFVGNDNLRQTGIQQNADGKAQEAKGQLSDLTQGISDRAQGALGNIGAAVTGDRETQAKYQDLHDVGKARQRGVESELQ
ncbi:uncharacterized protein TRUGW13939_04064 [Talaromyces rugulosus]|uniref:CsbD-like domain-containing protein n=1 Tax=Talaromyces rugulosus TaxID=121627 RepID=A0A7H8QT24_TALRU|nr:uncharacterized protein TRUGW13939_04064 [Talaromyces rugulosus]QKX56956.1 hypothetical protein TRUGW13939_04064 [Talaromyces rugulosus]